MIIAWQNFVVIADRLASVAAIVVILVTAVACVGSAIAFLIRRAGYNRDTLVSLTLVLLGVAIVGAGAGYVGGLSRVGAVGDIVSGVMGIFAAGTVYFLGASRTQGVTAALNAAAFSLALVTGFGLGAQTRAQTETFKKWEDACLSHFTGSDVKPLDADTTAKFVGDTCKLVLGRSRLGMTIQ